MAKSRRKPKSPPNLLQNSLVSLWHKMAAQSQPPAIDRFLARELSKLDGMSRKDRLWLGDLLTDALRFGALTWYCESWRREGWQSAESAAQRLAQHGQPLGPELWRRLARLPAPIVFFWTFMRKRLTGAELPAISAPGPDANEVWRTVRAECPASSSLALRALWAGLPPAMIPELESRGQVSHWSAQDALTFVDQHAARPPVWLRLLRPAAAPALRDELAEAHFSHHEVGLAWSAQGAGGIFELPAYRAGNFDLQDFASQSIGEAVAAQPGHLIWDCCAGAGGKSLQLAAVMAGQGKVMASDIHEGKLNDLRRRAERAGLNNIEAAVWDGKSIPDFGELIAANGGFDRVLVDAPCSGSGTWRHNVDGRLRLVPTEVERWTEVQKFLLNLTAAAVRPGGKLIYATCSWLPAENEHVVDEFLAANPTWRRDSQALAGNPTANSDTTFWAVLQQQTK